jgi:RND family efflux transporter MFP subunit
MNISLSRLKQKQVAIPLIVVFLFGVYVFISRDTTTSKETPTSIVKTVTVFDPMTLTSSSQFIEATGTVETLEAVELSSEVSARVARVSVALGNTVRRGQTLVVYNNADLAANLAGAEADVQSAQANKKSIEAQYDTQIATISKITSSGENAVAAAESAVRTAQNNLRQSTTITDTQVVRDVYTNSVVTLKSVQDTLQTVLTTADNILGIDNTFANDRFEDVFSIQDINKKNIAEQQYRLVKQNSVALKQVVALLTPASDTASIDAAVELTQATLIEYRTVLSAITDALDATPPVGGLTQAELDGLKSTIQQARTTIINQINTVTNQSQAIATAKNSADSLQITYEKAVQDVVAARQNVAADIAAATAQLKQIEASLELQDANIRSAKARVSAIRASLAKTVITAPISGTIAALPAKVGELMNPGQLAVRIVNTGSYQVKVFVPAESVSRIQKGNLARIANVYTGVVTNISPSIDPTTNRVEVLVLITEDDVSLVSEQFVAVSIEESMNEFDTMSRIPLESVRLTSEGAMVFVVNDSNILEAQKVSIGMVVGSTIEADIRDITRPIVNSVRGLDVGEVVTIQQ